MRNLIIIVTVLVLTAVLWAGWRRHAFNESKIAHPANIVEFESDMTEALARHIFQELQPKNPSALFLGFGEHLTSPSPAFIARFHDVQPPVKSFQSSVLPPNGMIIDKSTGRAGQIVQIIKIEPFVADEFEVEVAISTSRAGWDHFTYRIFDLAGEWKVKSRQPA